MILDDEICKNCLASGHCDVLPHSTNCDEVRAMAEHDKGIYNKALDDFAKKLKSECREHYVDCDPYFGGIIESILYEDDIDEILEMLKITASSETK